MKRKLICLLLVLFVALSLPFFALASERAQDKIVDDAGLLTASEKNTLEQTACDLTDTLEIDIVIVTVWSLGGKSAMEYADDYYDDHGYGVGADDSGILLLIAMESREWYMSTCGEAIYIFTDYGLDRLGDEIAQWLSSGDYYRAFDSWMEMLPQYVEAYRGGDPYDGYAPPDNYYGNDEEIYYYQPDISLQALPIALLIGAVAALIVILIMRAKMNTAKFKSGAGDYLEKGSYHLKQRHDVYLYSHVTKTKRQTSSSGGGSSTHRSGGGVRHGGRGGRF